MLELITTADLAGPAPAPRWLWPDLLAGGMTTLLTSPWKAGKTTFLSVLLARASKGLPFAGQPVDCPRAIVVSEESREVWHGRVERLGLGAGIRLALRPFRGQPTPAEWRAFIADLAEEPADLVVFDPLAMFYPAADENHAPMMLDALRPLQRLTERGTAVLLVHHPRKKAVGDLSPRGSGALAGFCDILATLEHPAGAPERHRRLTTNSRLQGRRVQWLSLNAAAEDYDVVVDAMEPGSFAANWPVMKLVFEDACERLTRHKVRDQWPDDYDVPSLATISRWLDSALTGKLLVRRGQGRRYHPFVYALPGKRGLLPDLPPLGPFQDRVNAQLMRDADKAAQRMEEGEDFEEKEFDDEEEAFDDEEEFEDEHGEKFGFKH